MKESLINNLEQLVARHEEIGGLLSDPEVIGDQNRFRDLSREYARLEPVVSLFLQYGEAIKNQQAAQEMCEDSDAEIRELGKEEIAPGVPQFVSPGGLARRQRGLVVHAAPAAVG